MIIVIDALNKHLFSGVLDEMFRLRARVFGDRLGWKVNIQDGKEIDEFDHLDPAYVVGLDPDGHVVAAVRALQTTGPHMLADVFSDILCGEPPIRSATMWESTRFCVDTQRLNRTKDRNSVSYATCELMIGSLEYARKSGIKDIVTVIDPVMDRVLKRSDNAPYDYVGQTVPMGKVPALAALLDTSEERVEKVRKFAGICHDVFLSDDEALALFNKKRVVSFPEQGRTARSETGELTALEAYFLEQIRAADTDKELKAVYDLIDALPQEISVERRSVLKNFPASLAREI
ncbi:acyl-homoserine-lactone synthase [Ruegeria aquimaris]|uniref:Acyl-homoserine-lactone synthase n=1 Tax=Ruegeria aquimaris TaxID=2984333 RepID=A0ABT3AEB6_9RHOB|nr:acyl-homoserine-lactone synthase [Ruegeria sp. XHP0148]MCV2887024.1 autoinducer synthase [Ruegeria sp. XHP0148]